VLGLKVGGVSTVEFSLNLYRVGGRFCTMRYKIGLLNVRSKADMSQLNLPHGTDN